MSTSTSSSAPTSGQVQADTLGQYAIAATTFTDQDKTDVIHSTLLAQLAAYTESKSYDNIEAWLTKVLQTAGVFGWMIQSGSTFKTVAQDDLKGSIDMVVAKYIIDSRHTNDLRVLIPLLYLRGSHSPDALRILDEHGKTKSVGTFQLVICEKTKDQDIIIRIFPYGYNTTKDYVHSTIFQKIERPNGYHMKYMSDPTICVLNMHAYDRLRSAVDDKVKDYLNRVAFLDI
ncbi:hypothetical protein BDN70DRAFT_936173 [Pholiota conissans]|uniref:Uncharacterized protein n=1 Tax=Pholiota conissans TaxID=109636 RepID=A0A9P5YTY6_9AGAR|nr:hypothetical protein BDN70DRAFT_936173 [Pholiota conissans]